MCKPSSLALFCLSTLLCAAAVQADAGQAHSREYQVDVFDRVHFSGSAQLHLVQGPPRAQQQVAHLTATGLLPSLERLAFENADGVLYIDAGDRQEVEQLVIRLRVSQLKEVVSEGNGQVLTSGLKLRNLALEGRGAGRFHLQHLQVEDLIVVGNGFTSFEMSGAAEHQFVDLAGVGRYQARALASQTSQVHVRGTGQVDVWVEELLDVNLSGAARVRYSGAPWVLQRITGSGGVDRLR